MTLCGKGYLLDLQMIKFSVTFVLYAGIDRLRCIKVGAYSDFYKYDNLRETLTVLVMAGLEILTGIYIDSNSYVVALVISSNIFAKLITTRQIIY